MPDTAPMHADQLHPTAADVAALLADQFPRWAHRPVRPVRSHGTVSALFRVGDDLLARLPLVAGDSEATRAAVEHEAAVARRLLAADLPVATPEPLAVGAPGDGFPVAWSLWRWQPGVGADAPGVVPDARLAHEIAGFVRSLRALDTGGATFTGDGRGGRPTDHDDDVARYLANAVGLVDTDAVRAAWARWGRTPRDGTPDVWTHGDLMPGNLLLDRGRLVAVIDVGSAGPADPALDLQPAWNLLDAPAREVFRTALDVDDATWDRGRAWALAQAIGCLAYYRVTNPVMSRTAARTLAELLAGN